MNDYRSWAKLITLTVFALLAGHWLGPPLGVDRSVATLVTLLAVVVGGVSAMAPRHWESEHEILVGALWVNAPIILWTTGPVIASELYYGLESILIKLLLLVVGLACGWIWWSVNVTLWRAWALERAANIRELQSWGQDAKILWPKGHPVERIELGALIRRMQQRYRMD